MKAFLFICIYICFVFGRSEVKEVLPVARNDIPVCNYPALTGANTIFNSSDWSPPPSNYKCDGSGHYTDYNIHLADSFEGFVFVCYDSDQDRFSEAYDCSQSCAVLTIESITCPLLNYQCVAFNATGNWHYYLDGNDYGPTSLVWYGLGECPSEAIGATTSYSTTSSSTHSSTTHKGVSSETIELVPKMLNFCFMLIALYISIN